MNVLQEGLSENDPIFKQYHVSCHDSHELLIELKLTLRSVSSVARCDWMNVTDSRSTEFYNDTDTLTAVLNVD